MDSSLVWSLVSLPSDSFEDRSAAVPRWAPFSGAHFDDLSDCVLDVLAYLLQRDVDVLGGIIGHSPAAALLGVRVLVAEDCPPCHDLAVLVLETIAVNTHAAALAHLVVIHCVLRPANAA